MRQELEDLIEAVESAINAGDWKVDGACDPTSVLIRAKKAIEQAQKQEPVAWRFKTGTWWNREVHWRYLHSLDGTEGLLGLQPLYTSPPQRQPLSDEDIVEVLGEVREQIIGNVFLAFARAIEQAHGIKGDL